MLRVDLLESINIIEVSPPYPLPSLLNIINLFTLPLTGLFWKAPELLRNPDINGTQKGDVYAFAIILYEICGRKGPFGATDFEPKEIIDLVRNVPCNGKPFRPEMDALYDMENVPDYVISCITDCWGENADARPDFPTIR